MLFGKTGRIALLIRIPDHTPAGSEKKVSFVKQCLSAPDLNDYAKAVTLAARGAGAEESGGFRFISCGLSAGCHPLMKPRDIAEDIAGNEGRVVMPVVPDLCRSSVADIYKSEGLTLFYTASTISGKRLVCLSDKGVTHLPAADPALLPDHPGKAVKTLLKKGDAVVLVIDFYGEADVKVIEKTFSILSAGRKRLHPYPLEELFPAPAHSQAPCAPSVSPLLFRTPAERHATRGTISPPPRELVSNMSGNAVLSGPGLELEFECGTLSGIRCGLNHIFSSSPAGMWFRTRKNCLVYTNESAFSFDDEREYGMRALYSPDGAGRPSNRIITDYYFIDGVRETVISMTVNYPEFEGEECLDSYALMEIPLFNLTEGLQAEITATGPFGDICRTTTNDETGDGFIFGSEFSLNCGGKGIILRYPDPAFSPGGLAFRISAEEGKRVFRINPGGSYFPCPAAAAAGLSERFVMTLSPLTQPHDRKELISERRSSMDL